MKRTVIYLFIFTLLLGICGCSKPSEVDINQIADSSAPVIKPQELAPEYIPKNVTVSYGDNRYTMRMLSEDQLSSVTRLENSVLFDLELLSDLDWIYDDYLGNACYANVPPSPPSYADYMKLLSSNGIIVAGYATGRRESHDTSKPYIPEDGQSEYFSPTYEYTTTQFHVTDIYYGTPKGDTLPIREWYTLELDEENRALFYSYSIARSNILRNGEQMLMFLRWDPETQHYCKIKKPIPLMPDYRNYNDAYLSSVLDFYRGDRTEYRKNASPDPTLLEAADPERLSKYTQTFYWPKREISDEALLEEMSDHLLIRLATDYKIALWPYGHRNFLYTCTSNDFILCSSPLEE